MDDPELGAHHHHMPDWGRILWRRQWQQAAETDRHAAAIHHLKETLVATQADIDALAAVAPPAA